MFLDPTQPLEILTLRAGRFEAALQLARALYEGAPLAKWLQRITSALAAACVRMQQAEHSSASSAGPGGGSGQLSAASGLFGEAFLQCSFGHGGECLVARFTRACWLADQAVLAAGRTVANSAHIVEDVNPHGG